MEKANVETPIDVPAMLVTLPMPGITAITVSAPVPPVSVIAAATVSATTIAVTTPVAVVAVSVPSAIITAAAAVVTAVTAAGIIVGYEESDMRSVAHLPVVTVLVTTRMQPRKMDRAAGVVLLY